ncbi:MAG: VPS10 domain-containing protein [Bacteroidota bacterium]
MKRIILFLLLFILNTPSYSQPFLQKQSNSGITFLEAEKQFNDWKSKTDISKIKGWKSYRRLASEIYLHTDASGNTVSSTNYLQALVDASHQKNSNALNRITSGNWLPVGPYVIPNNLTGYMENGIGRINCIAFHPTDPNTYFVGVAQGGVWKTSDNGQTWMPLTDQLPITRVSDIEIDANNPNVMYISLCDYEYIGIGLFLNGKKRNTHYGLGVYKTTDGGLTWNSTGLGFTLQQGDASLIRKILIHPNNSNKVIACGVNGVYASNDAGQTWNKTLDSLMWDMVQDPVTPTILYAASGWVRNAGIGSAAIYKSSDFGQTWSVLNTGFPATGYIQRIKICIAPNDPNCIYALTVDANSGMEGLYKSTNAGTTWTNMNVGLNLLDYGDGTGSGGQGTYDLALCVNQTNKDEVYVGGINIWESIDGGQTFNPVSHWTTSYGPTIHADVHAIKQQPLTGNVFVCNDGGISRTTNIISQSWNDANSGTPWPTQWTNLGYGLGVTSFYRVSSSKNLTGRIVAGAQDNSTFYFDGNAWSCVFGGDGMDNYLDPMDDNVVLGSSQYGGFYYSTDNGLSSQGFYPNINSELAEWTTPVVADYANPGTFYVGFQNVVKSVDNGNTWQSISNFTTQTGTAVELSALAIGQNNPNVIVAARRVRYEYNEPGALYVTTNGGASWNDRTLGLPDSLYYTSVEVNRSQSNTIYVSMAGFVNGQKVFKSDNNGLTWQNITYNLPNLPVNCIKNVPGTPMLLAATDIGIYKLDSASMNWILYSQGLPNVITTDIEFNQVKNKIYVSTFGRGIWETDLTALTGLPTSATSQNKISIFPTINHGIFTIDLRDVEKQKLKMTILDVLGKVVKQEIMDAGDLTTIQLNESKGLYYIKLEGSTNLGSSTIIIQ